MIYYHLEWPGVVENSTIILLSHKKSFAFVLPNPYPFIHKVKGVTAKLTIMKWTKMR